MVDFEEIVRDFGNSLDKVDFEASADDFETPLDLDIQSKAGLVAVENSSLLLKFLAVEGVHEHYSHALTDILVESP